MINLTASTVTPENIVTAFNQLKQELTVLRSQIKTTQAQSTLLEESHIDADTITLSQWMSSPEFLSGFTGSGFKLEQVDGNWRLTVDELFVRKIMHIYELLIQQIQAQGGTLIISPAAGSAKVVQMTAVTTPIV